MTARHWSPRPVRPAAFRGGRRTTPPHSCTVAQSSKYRRASGSTDPSQLPASAGSGTQVLRNGLEPWHFLIVAVVLIALSGSEKLPDIARTPGTSMRILKSVGRCS
ncbi:twin-arginine translocase TatA/TatE family subunit [Streptomyces sp. NPDC005181]|uniref:twin-arginine translocase TatA/TatE family subunit n=1 Tax=Streptomyces sp. NPDC005181 TaxID=3156869 RepID=UPI0033A438C6